MCSAPTPTCFRKPLRIDTQQRNRALVRVNALSTNLITIDSEPQWPVEEPPDQTSQYFLDLDRLVSGIDSATTYYQILGVERTDGQESIKASFQQLLNQLFPPYVISRTMPATLTQRVERAFNKSAQAFGVLASDARRKDYDSALLSIANKPAAAKPPQVSRLQTGRTGAAPRSDSSSVAAKSYDLNIGRMPQPAEAHRESSKAREDDNRRRCERFKVSIPARVTGYDRKNGKWHEMTQTMDVSRTGVRLRLRRRVKHGTVLFLTFPLPQKLRSHGFAEQSYNVYTLVRRVEPPKQGVRAIGVEFLGEHPPSGFLDKPWAVFRSNRWGGSERRRNNREERAEIVNLEYFDENMQSIAKEPARTENVSRSGLRISGTVAPPEFDLIMVSCPSLKFEGLATLRSRYLGKDGLERLCVQLVEKEFPARG
jgi:PilZ domain/DnaJ domain